MKLALHGHGRMGAAVERVAAGRGHEVSGVFDGAHPIDAAALAGIDAIVDFSAAAAVPALVECAALARVNLVIGTTGWNERLEEIRAQCQSAGIGVVYAANFSPGATAVFALARRAGELFAQFGGYESGLEERHHSRKKDAPSGTAIRIAAEVAAGSGGALDPAVGSLRVGSEFGLHTVFFDSEDDLVEISHRARGRDGFARGAVLAAERIAGRKGFFRFDELLGL